MIDRLERNVSVPTEQQPAVGRIVLYRNVKGVRGVLPAIVQFTEESYVPGYWADGETDRLGGDGLDRDGQFWVPSAVPPVKEGCVHLVVFGQPIRAELNVPEDGRFDCGLEQTPGTWRWPTRV